MTVTLGQQYNIGEKPTVILYTYINRHAGTPEKQRRQKSKSSNMVVIIDCNIVCDDKVITLKQEQREGHDLDIFIIQKVQDTVIHLEVDEEQWKVTQASKRQAKCVWSPRTMSGLRLTDTPHVQTVSYEEIFPGNFGVGGVKNFLGKTPVSYEEIFRQNFLAQNFLRKFWLEFSQPRKF